MSFADFLMTVPSGVRLLLAITITVGISVLCVWRFHLQILRVGGWPAPAYDDPIVQQQPKIGDLVGRLLALTMTAFVFLLAFTLGNFWSGQEAGREASQNESADFDRALSLAGFIPAGQGREEIEGGLMAYRDGVLRDVVPALQQADLEGAGSLQRAADVHLQTAIGAAYARGADKSPAWSELSSIVSDLASDGQDRVNALPDGNTARGSLVLIFTLGLASLAFTAIYVPAPLKANMVLVGLLAAITAVLLFVVVEAANPYVGSAAISDILTLPTG